MSVLSALELSQRILDPRDRFTVSPILDWTRQVSDGSIDLRLDWEFIVIARTRFASLNPLAREQIKSDLSQYQQRVHIPYGHKFVLHPNELVLGSTVEFLSFPQDLMAYVIGRSSWGRLGLIIATATTINPGFKGNLTLELVNAGNVPIELYPGVRIAQLVIHTLSLPEAETAASKYALQIGPGFSKIYDDPELELLRSAGFRSIIGVTGHKGSGKSVLVSHLLEDLSYGYYSLSHIVRELFEAKHFRPASRVELQDFGDQLRRDKGGDYLARELLRRLKRDDRAKGGRIVIDGIRNGHEVRFLARIPHFRLIAVVASKNKITANLRERGFLVDDAEYARLQEALLDPQIDEAERGKVRRLLEDKITAVQFEANYARDAGGMGDLGQDIDACIELAGEGVLRNDGDVPTLLAALRDFLRQMD